jgi:hypothetical protein
MAYLQLPNGRYLEIPEGMSPEEAYAKAQRAFPNAFEVGSEKAAKRGLGAALGKGTESFLGSVGTAGKALFGDENLAAQEALAKQEELSKKYADQVSLDRLKEVYEKQGLIAAGKELAGQIPLAIAEQAPNIAATLASAKLGAMGGTAVMPGAGTLVGGVLGAAAPSLLSLAGSNIERQAAEQVKAGAPLDISTGKAFGTAVPQAALETAAMFIPLGGKVAGKVFGPEVEKLLMSGGTKAAEKLAQESFKKTLGMGLLKGAAAEIPTEITQQMLERAQAGLDLTSPEALKEYGETAYQVGLLAPIGGAGRFIDKSSAKGEVEKEADARAKEIAKQQKAARDQEKLLEQQALETEELVKQQQATGDMFGDVAGKARPLPETFTQTGARVPTAAERVDATDYKVPEFAATGLPTTTLREREKAAQMASVEGLPTYDDVTRTKSQLETLAQQTSARVNAALEAGDTDAYRELAPQLENLRLAIDATDKQLKAIPKPKKDKTQAELEADLSRLQADFKKYTGEAFDKAKLDKIADSIEDTKAKLKAYTAPAQTSLFDENAQIERAPTAAEQAQDAQSREVLDAEAMQEEIERSRGIADQYMRLPTADEYKAQLKALKDERAALLKDPKSVPWYMKGRVAEIEAEIAALQPKVLAAVAGTAKGTPVRPVAGIKQEQNAKLDEILTRVEQLQEAPKDKTLVNLADKASQDYIMLALEEMDAERLKQNMGRLSDPQVLGLVQEMRRAFAPVIANKSTGMLMYPQEGRRVTGLSPLAQQLEDIKAEFAQGEEEFMLKTQYGQPRRETRSDEQELARLREQRKTATGEIAKGIDQDIKRLQEKKVDVSNVGVIEQAELFGEANQKAVKKANVAAIEEEVADLEEKFKKANDGKNIKAAFQARAELEAKKEELKSIKEGKLAELPELAIVRSTPKNFVKFLGSAPIVKIRNELKALAAKVNKAQELSKQTPREYLEFAKQIAEQRAFVADIFNAKKSVADIRASAAALWNEATTLKELIAKTEGLIKSRDVVRTELKNAPEPREGFPDTQREAFKERLRVLNDLISRSGDLDKLRASLAEAEASRERSIKMVDALYEQANEIENASLKTERAILASMERTLARMPKASQAAIKLEADAETARAQIGRHEAAIRKDLEDQVKQKREAEQASFEVLGGLGATRRVLAQVPSAAVKSENISKFGKQIREKEALLATLPENTRGYIDLSREIAQLKEKRAAEITPLNVPVTTTRIAPTTADEKLETARKQAVQTAKERAEDKKRQQERLEAGLSERPDEVKEGLDLLNGKLAKVEKEIAKDAKNVDDYTKALDAAKTEKGKKHWQTKLDKLNDSIAAKDLATTQESLKKKIKQLKEKGADAEAILKSLGDKPAKTQKQAPIKTGTAKPARAKKSKVDFDEDAVAHGVRYDDYMFVKQGLEFGFKAREEAPHGGAGVSQTAAQAEVNKVKLPKGLKIVVLNKLSGNLRDDVIAQGRNPESVRGGVMPNGGVFIVAENHADIKDLKKTIAHELTGHLGVEGLLGEAGMNALIKKITSQYGSVFKLADTLNVTEDVLGAYQAAKRIGKTEEQALATAVREMIAHTEEARIDKGMLAKVNEFIKAMVGAVRSALRKIGIDLDISTSDIFKLLRDARKDFNEGYPGAYVNKDGDILFSDKPPVANPGFQYIVSSADKILATQKPWKDIIKGGLAGLVFKTKYVDRFAPLQKIARGMEDSLKASQLMYFLRMHDQRMAFTSQVASYGPNVLKEKTRADGQREFLVESEEGASLAKIAKTLRDAEVGSPEATNRVFTLYLLAKRAKRVGLSKLNFSGKVTQEMLDNTMDAVNANAATKEAFEAAADMYNEYNKGLVNFAVQTGAISKEAAKNMLSTEDYVPFYRAKDNGDIMLDVGGAPPVKIGNIKDQPYLHELVGGDQPILDFFTSSLQNTSMLTDMALRNLATRNVAFTLGELGLLERTDKEVADGKTGIRVGDGPMGVNLIRFSVEPDPRIKGDEGKRYAIVDSDAAGIPSELLVRGLEGVNTALPTAIKMLNVPANLLRKWVTRNPAYALRQIVRDPMNAVMVSGADTIPVVSSFKEIYKMVKGKSEGEPLLQRRGILGGQVLTGTSEDMQKILNDITAGKKGWNYRLAQLDQLAIQGDAATRVVMYNSFIKQGLSEMEATLATLEAMNFSKRGMSSSLFMLASTVPFMNAQIQGLNVLYDAFRGNMPFNEKLKVKKKLIQRGLMMMGFTLLYAAMMQDDEAYQNANDDEKYANWFIHTPLSDEPLKVPIPFELGFMFKAVPEGVANAMFGDEKGRDVGAALFKMAFNSIPISGPQGIKPALEVALNHSFFTGRDIESKRLQQYEPGERYTERTSEIAKSIGGALNISPTKIEYLIRGYTGSLPLAAASMANPILRSGETGEQPEARGVFSSETPLIGTFFQAKDAQGLVNKAYKDMEEINEARSTYKKMVAEGREAQADDYLEANADMIAMGSFAGRFRKKMGDFTNMERVVRSDNTLSAQEKREQLDEIRQMKIELAKQFSSARE